MKIQKSLSIIFLLIATIIKCEDGRTYVIKTLEKYVRQMGTSTFPNFVVEKYENNVIDVIFDTIEPSELDDIKIMYNLPDSLIKQAKSVKVNEPSIQKNVKENNPYNILELSLSIAYKEDNGKISLALITTRSKAIVRKQYETYNVKKCDRFLMFKNCHTEQQTVERDLDLGEMNEVVFRIRFEAYKKLLEVVDILKKGDKLIRNGSDISLK